jgi:hypothetical protein
MEAQNFVTFPTDGEETGEFISYLNYCRSANDIGITKRRFDTWRKKNDSEDILKHVDCYPKKLVEQMRLGAFPPEQLPLEMIKLLDHYKSLNFTWKEFATMESLNIKWLRSWRRQYDYDDLYDHLEDRELDELIMGYIADHPDRGEVMIIGCLRAAGFNVQRQRIRDSLNRVDPKGRQQRKHGAIKRRVYSVPGPHHLWHMDGYHKLRRFHLVIHAAIDGFTRLCTFARCNDNNEAATVLQDFLGGVKDFGCPSRV